DPQIGVLRLDTLDDKPFAVIYNFACHPIMGMPNGDNTADIIGVASNVVEQHLGEGVVTLFVQGCAGDINPVRYKSVHEPRHSEPLGQKLGLSVLRTAQKIRCGDANSLKIIAERLAVPRADFTERIDKLE